MKFIVFAILLVSLVSSSHSTLLTSDKSWEEDVEIIIDLLRYSYKGFMSKFHFVEEYPLHDKCMGTEFVIDVQEIIKVLQSREDDFILKIIKIFERLGHMYEISEAHWDVNKLMTEIDTQCFKVGCDYFKLFLRGESHMFELIELYKDMMRLLETHFKDIEEAEEVFRLIGVDWAKGFHIMLAMK